MHLNNFSVCSTGNIQHTTSLSFILETFRSGGLKYMWIFCNEHQIEIIHTSSNVYINPPLISDWIFDHSLQHNRVTSFDLNDSNKKWK